LPFKKLLGAPAKMLGAPNNTLVLSTYINIFLGVYGQKFLPRHKLGQQNFTTNKIK